MKAVILAGGLGTRLSEETDLRPKPMIEIGAKPILWHILKLYSHYGINDFIICCGYKGYLIKEYFNNYFLHNSDVTIDFKKNNLEFLNKIQEPWKITLIDTGQGTQTAGRLLKVQDYIQNDTFMLTYGDGVGNINLNSLLEQHKKEKKQVTLTAVQPPGRFGDLVLNINQVIAFKEKPTGEGSWINGGFFVIEPSAINLISNYLESWEADILPKIASANNLGAYRHDGFWLPMDTLRDKKRLQKLWDDGAPPWKVW